MLMLLQVAIIVYLYFSLLLSPTNVHPFFYPLLELSFVVFLNRKTKLKEVGLKEKKTQNKIIIKNKIRN
jgi:hypothetical protein